MSNTNFLRSCASTSVVALIAISNLCASVAHGAIPTQTEQRRILMQAIRSGKVSPQMGAMISHLDAYRKAVRDHRRFHGRAPWQSNDNPRNLVEGEMLVNINQLDQFREVSLAKAADGGESAPWSDTYWPLYTGQLADRFQDRAFSRGEEWKDTFTHFANATPKDVNQWSVAEKYDLVMGLNSRSNNSLTQQAWNSTQEQEVGGKVETWMGICHGWSPAAMMVDRPHHSVVVPSADGKQAVTFYADEIKGLASLLYATGNYSQKFIGGRCNIKLQDLVRAGANARKQYPECYDTNAGTWHIAAINMLRKGRSFVIDATTDFEVWNQPVKAYRFRYFNPATGAPANDVASATVAWDKFTNDKFREFRASGTDHGQKIASIVGVEMQLSYVSENSQTTWNWPQNRDEQQTLSYKYDLELDAQGNIIGGEWYDHLSNHAHPDFIWTPTWEVNGQAQKAKVVQNFASDGWNFSTPAPANWKSAAASWAQYDQPLAAFVETIVAASRR